MTDTWWHKVSGTAPARLAGLWFGLVELADGGWHLYVAGTDQFDAGDDTGDWAVGPYAWNDPVTYRNDPGAYHPVPEIEALTTSGAVDHIGRIVRALAPWRDIHVDGVAAGFDAGDFAIVYRRHDGPPPAAT